MSSDRAEERERIEVSSARVMILRDQWVRRWKRLPTEPELAGLIETWVREEVLYREALARGLDREDEIVRRRLVQKMHNLSFRLAWTSPPTEQEAEAFFRERIDRYTTPVRRTFRHRYFSVERRGHETENAAKRALEQLGRGEEGDPGDPFLLPTRFVELTKADVRVELGVEFADGLFELDIGRWSGPVNSAFGLHLVYIEEEEEAAVPTFESVREIVMEDLHDARQRSAQEQLVDGLRDRHEIVIDEINDDALRAEIAEMSREWEREHESGDWRRSIDEIARKVDALLPPRYQGRVDDVSAAPMSSADLSFDEEGQVAWDKMWGADDPNQPFCELSIAGGPPHRGTLLEPVDPQEVVNDLDAYTTVLQELSRGLTMVTGRPVVMSSSPGWIGLRCDSEDMAIWLLRAIVVENVMVRREDDVLLFPAGPKFTLAGEIKNVVTACAKTFHYWNEHVAALTDEHE